MAESFRFSPAPAPPPGSGTASGAWEEMTDARGQVRPHWQGLGAKILRWTADERRSLGAAASRMIADLGTTFNVYRDAGAAGQPYELDPIPLIVSPAEWAAVSAGLAQRIRLIDRVLADLYGPQQLLKDGLIPPDLVHASPAFLEFARNVQPVGGKFVVTTGCDLVRDASGGWAVLKDHTSAPGGLGQVLENRNVSSNLLSDQFEALRVSRLGTFFNLERATLLALSTPRGEMPNVVFLTPGFRHPSYFEHAYKARLLGFPLVEPADLTVRERRLFLKTLSGLRRIDGVACRVAEDGLDPLEHGTRGGVPGIVEAWRTGNVALANAPGAGFASTPALMPFLPGICREWLGEDILLPFVETWWLSQADVRRRALAELNRYVLLSAYGRDDEYLPLRCSGLSPAARKWWLSAIEERPYDFVVQLDVTPSEAPSLESRGIRSRPVVWRAFTVNAATAPAALPGGLARVGKTGQAPQMWPYHEGFTKDVWIPDEAADFMTKADFRSPRPAKDRHPSALEVPSRIAEQLFWVGRYAERIELATRLLRVTLRNLSGEAGRHQREELAACLTLIRGTNLLPKTAVFHSTRVVQTLAALIHDQSSRAGIPGLTRSLLKNAAAARDRLSDDTWRFFNRLEGIVNVTDPGEPSASELLRTLDTVILHLAAFAGMQAENMTRGHGWRFLEIGRRLERALSGLKLLRAATTAAGPPGSESPVLNPLLETCDSVMTYRRRHFSRPRLDAVIDLIFSDTANPRSVAYQIGIIRREITRFPGDPAHGLLPRIRGEMDDLAARIATPPEPDAAVFDGFIDDLEDFSDLVTQHYFSHSVRHVY